MNIKNISNTLWMISNQLLVIQDEIEYKEFAEFLLTSNLNLDNCLEIGVNSCGMIPLYCNLFKNVYGIDAGKHPNVPYMKSLYSNFNFIEGFTYDINTIKQVSDLNIKFDMIFIDADHMYSSVKQDFEIYNNFISDEGIIVFHDIKKTSPDINKNCEVDIFWNEIKQKYHRFIEITNNSSVPVQHNIINNKPPCNWGGIGILFNSHRR